MALGRQSNQPRFLSLQAKTAPIRLASGSTGHFLALPSRGPVQPMALERHRYFKLPNRPDGEAGEQTAHPVYPSPALPAPAKESDTDMHATVSTQAMISQSGRELTDPIDLILAHAAKASTTR